MDDLVGRRHRAVGVLRGAGEIERREPGHVRREPAHGRAPRIPGWAHELRSAEIGVCRSVQVEAPALDEDHRGGRGDRLGDRRQIERRVRGGGHPSLAIGEAEPLLPHDRVTARDGDGDAGNGVLRHPRANQLAGGGEVDRLDLVADAGRRRLCVDGCRREEEGENDQMPVHSRVARCLLYAGRDTARGRGGRL